MAMLEILIVCHWFTFGEENMRSLVHWTWRRLEITNQPAHRIFRWRDQVDTFHCLQWLTFLIDVFDNCWREFSLIAANAISLIFNSLVIPSALKSCILVHAETILIESLSTTRTRHSTTAALPGGVFFWGPLYLMTSFMISRKKKQTCWIPLLLCRPWITPTRNFNETIRKCDVMGNAQEQQLLFATFKEKSIIFRSSF